MIGKTNLFWTTVFTVALLAMFAFAPHPGQSADFETGSTTMNVSVRGFVSISASNCITNGIAFATKDPNTNDNNATCNNITEEQPGGTGYNLTVDGSSTTDINFTHAVNRTNLTDGTNEIDINYNLTYNSNSTFNNASNLLDTSLSETINTTWDVMENCTALSDNENCWATYFLDIPDGQAPGNYYIGYCWCGRRTGTAEGNCGTCT